MKYLSYLLIAVLGVARSLLAACYERLADLDKPQTYQQDGISFVYPGNWKVTEDTTIEHARFIFLESTAEAIIKVEIYPIEESYELEEFVELDIESLQAEYPKIFNISNSHSVSPIVTPLSNIDLDGYQYEFTISLLGVDVPHVSNYYQFNSETLSAYVSQQVAVDDLGKVVGGFHLVLDSFKVE